MAGGLVGPLIVWRMVRPLGAPTLLAGCAVLVCVIGALFWLTERASARPGAAIARRGAKRNNVAGKSNPTVEGAKLAAASRYLLAIAAIVFLYELVSQVLDYQYSTAAESLEGAGATQGFFGAVGTIIGFVGVFTQIFLVSFVIRAIGLTTALLVLPAAMAVALSAVPLRSCRFWRSPSSPCGPFWPSMPAGAL